MAIGTFCEDIGGDSGTVLLRANHDKDITTAAIPSTLQRQQAFPSRPLRRWRSGHDVVDGFVLGYHIRMCACTGILE